MGTPPISHEAAILSAALAILGAATALLATCANLWFSRKNLKRESLNQQVNLISAGSKHFEEFRKWADQVADALTEAIHLCDLEPGHIPDGKKSFFDRRHRLLIAISTMIDRGRWFFPNVEVDDYGANKELGYRGYRHELLDGLVEAYRCLNKMDYRNRNNNRPLRNDLTNCKRHFVGQVQKILDPIGVRDHLVRIQEEILKGAPK